MQGYLGQIADHASSVKNMVSGAFKGMEDALVTFTRTGKLNFASMANTIINDMIRIQIQQSIMKPLASAVGNSGGIGSFIGGLFNANGNVFGGAQAGSTGSVQAFASGGAFTGSIVNSPTPFKFASGGGFNLGVMGEAGPEAVVPLTRSADGNLGVRMVGGEKSGNAVTVNVVVNTQAGSVDSKAQGTGANASAMQQLGSQIGSVVRDILLQEKRPGGLIA